MAKKKPVKKPAKAKTTKTAKAAKKTAKAGKRPTAKAAKAPKANKRAAQKTTAKKSPRSSAKGKKAAPKVEKRSAKGRQAKPSTVAPKEKKGKKAKEISGEVVEVVVAPSNPVLRDIRKDASPKSAAAPAAKKRCRETACDQEGVMGGYCRLHYIKNWRRIKRKEAILASGQLNNYVEELVKKYPDKYLDVIRQDLASEKEWAKVVVDLELESSDDDSSSEEEIDPVAEGVRRDRDFDEEDGNF